LSSFKFCSSAIIKVSCSQEAKLYKRKEKVKFVKIFQKGKREIIDFSIKNKNKGYAKNGE